MCMFNLMKHSRSFKEAVKEAVTTVTMTIIFGSFVVFFRHKLKAVAVAVADTTV